MDGGEPGTSRSSMTSDVFPSEPGSRLSETGTGTEKTDKKGARRGRFQVHSHTPVKAFCTQKTPGFWPFAWVQTQGARADVRITPTPAAGGGWC